jgi:5-oxoprolinase (ATP-hydrolysing)
MNNFLFGNERFGYYETMAGGSGALIGHDGVDAVHTHMTNTRITDPEILEHRYPVQLEQFSIRKNSGGNGEWKGGNGVVREFLFTEKVSVNILAEHRKERPFGLRGGETGATGEQQLVQKNGKVKQLSGRAQIVVQRGEKLVIKTPGGGGVGKIKNRGSFFSG